MLHKHERKRKPQTRRKRKQTDKRQSHSKPYMSTSSDDWKFNKTKLCGLFTLNWTNQWTRKRACKVFSFIVHPAYERMRGEYLVEWLEEIKWEDWRTENIFIMERSVEYPSAYWFPVFLLSFNKCYRDGIILGWKVKKKNACINHCEELSCHVAGHSSASKCCAKPDTKTKSIYIKPCY